MIPFLWKELHRGRKQRYAGHGQTFLYNADVVTYRNRLTGHLRVREVEWQVPTEWPEAAEVRRRPGGSVFVLVYCYADGVDSVESVHGSLAAAKRAAEEGGADLPWDSDHDTGPWHSEAKPKGSTCATWWEIEQHEVKD